MGNSITRIKIIHHTKRFFGAIVVLLAFTWVISSLPEPTDYNALNVEILDDVYSSLDENGYGTVRQYYYNLAPHDVAIVVDQNYAYMGFANDRIGYVTYTYPDPTHIAGWLPYYPSRFDNTMIDFNLGIIRFGDRFETESSIPFSEVTSDMIERSRYAGCKLGSLREEFCVGVVIE